MQYILQTGTISQTTFSSLINDSTAVVSCEKFGSDPIIWSSITAKPIFHGTSISMKNLNSLQWRNNELDGVSNHRSLGCLLNRLFRRRSKKKNQSSASLALVRRPVDSPHKWPVTANVAENVFIWWRHHVNGPASHYYNISNAVLD